MWKPLLALTIFINLCCSLYAQSLSKAATDAFVLTRMVEKFHFQPKPLNDQLSSAIYAELLKQVDDEKTFLTADDIKVLSSYQYQLDDEIRNRKTAFLETLVSIYQKRLLQADSMITDISKTAYNFSLPEKLRLQKILRTPQTLLPCV